MPEFCSCGAQLPPDALFCHKCGKPQREIVAPEPPPPPVQFTAPPPPLRESLPVNFRNPVALRIAFSVAIGATILSFVVPFLNWIAGGFFAVLFYRRSTGSFLNVNAGLRLGWITGILAFVLYSILFTLLVLPQMSNLIQQQSASLPASNPEVIRQMMRFFESPPGIAMALAAIFVLITLLTMAGGALGAKVVGRS